MRQVAGTMKKISLELGGNAPFIIFDDATVEQAVAGLAASYPSNCRRVGFQTPCHRSGMCLS